MIGGSHEGNRSAVCRDGMLLDAVETVDYNANAALAEGSDGGAAVVEGDLLRQLKIAKLWEHRDRWQRSCGFGQSIICWYKRDEVVFELLFRSGFSFYSLHLILDLLFNLLCDNWGDLLCSIFIWKYDRSCWFQQHAMILPFIVHLAIKNEPQTPAHREKEKAACTIPLLDKTKLQQHIHFKAR